jgi:hypothetical protein
MKLRIESGLSLADVGANWPGGPVSKSNVLKVERQIEPSIDAATAYRMAVMER